MRICPLRVKRWRIDCIWIRLSAIRRYRAGRFDTAPRRHLGVDHALAVSSGAAAIALGMISFELEPGSRVRAYLTHTGSMS